MTTSTIRKTGPATDLNNWAIFNNYTRLPSIMNRSYFLMQIELNNGIKEHIEAYRSTFSNLFAW